MSPMISDGQFIGIRYFDKVLFPLRFKRSNLSGCSSETDRDKLFSSTYTSYQGKRDTRTGNYFQAANFGFKIISQKM